MRRFGLFRFALWVRLLFLLFRKVTVERSWIDTVREQTQRGTVVYVLEVQGILDWALLNYVLERNGLPTPEVSNTATHKWLRPVLLLWLWPLEWLTRKLFRRPRTEDRFFEGVSRGKHGLIFLKRAKLVALPGSNLGLENLKRLAILQESLERPIILLPQMVFWTPSPQRYQKGVIDLLLGSPNAPGLRRFLSFLLNPGRATITSGPPLDVSNVLASKREADGETRDAEGTARTAQWLLHRSIDQEEKTVRGPMLKAARQVREEMMYDPDFLARVEAVGGTERLSPRQARKRATRSIREIAADFRIGYIEMVSLALTPAFRRMFSSFVVDREAIQTIRDALRETPVVLIPSHRSRVDYLIISYLLYLKGLVPPHLAVGSHLSIFPLGSLFRHCGAFFVRKEADEDPIYTLALSQYIRKLLKEGHSLEFFIEGGRSRTGKTTRPKFGLLGHIAEAVSSGAVRDVTIIPIALSYERVVEVEDYTRELAGIPEAREDLLKLVRSAERLDARHGRMYLTAGKPIRVANYLENTLGRPLEELAPQDLSYLVKRLGYLVLDRVNRATVINPSGLVATVLLSHLRRGISMARFQETAGFLMHFSRKRGYQLSITLERSLIAARQTLLRARQHSEESGDQRSLDQARGKAASSVLSEALELFSAQRCIQVEEVDELPVISVAPASRMVLSYYRNLILHVFQREALVATALRPREGRMWVTREELSKDVAFLSQLFRREFVFRVGDLSRGIAAALASLEDAEIVRQEGDLVHPVARNQDRLQVFRNMVLPIVESYLLCARYLDLLRFKGAMKRRELARSILRSARQEYSLGEVTCQEALSVANILNAVDYFLEARTLVEVESGLDAGKLRLAQGSTVEELLEVEERIRSFVNQG